MDTNSGRLSLLSASKESCFDTTFSGSVKDSFFKLGLDGAQLSSSIRKDNALRKKTDIFEKLKLSFIKEQVFVIIICFI